MRPAPQLFALFALLLTLKSQGKSPPGSIGGRYPLGPTYMADPATQPCSDCKRGEYFQLTMPIEGTLYNCKLRDNPSLSAQCAAGGACSQEFGVPGTRNLTVYVPAAYTNGEEVGVMVTQDGEIPMVRNIMDHLVGAKDPERSLPTFVYISVQLAGPGATGNCTHGRTPITHQCLCGDGQGTERFNEYATASDDYARFISTEVFPYVVNHHQIKAKFSNLKITSDPAGRMTTGCSNGGATAFKMVFFSPHLFGVAVAYSAALNFLDSSLTSNTTHPLGMADMWVPKPDGQELIATEPHKPIRVFHSGNQNDFGTNGSCFQIDGHDVPVPIPGRYVNFLEANNQTQTALEAKGYATRYAYGQGACHCQPDMMAEDLPNTLVWAWAEWKQKQAV